MIIYFFDKNFMRFSTCPCGFTLFDVIIFLPSFSYGDFVICDPKWFVFNII